MAKKNILAEAMADAKQLKEAALENAKATMQEHFTPKLKSMVDAALREEMEEDLDEKYGAEEESEKDFEDGSKPDKVKSRWGKESDKKPANEAKKDKNDGTEEEKEEDGEEDEKKAAEDTTDESLNLDALLRELEAEDDSEGETGEEEDEMKENDGYDKGSKEDAEEGEEPAPDKIAEKSADSEYNKYIQLKKKFEPESPRLKKGKEEDGEKETEVDEDSELAAIIRELEDEEDSEEDNTDIDEAETLFTQRGFLPILSKRVPG